MCIPECKYMLPLKNLACKGLNMGSAVLFQIRNGRDETYPLIGRYCGSSTPPVATSSAEEMWIKFKADGSTAFSGFSATYSESKSPQQHYSLTLREHHGISDHQQLSCLFNRLLWLTSWKRSNPYILAFCEGNPPVTSGSPHKRSLMRKELLCHNVIMSKFNLTYLPLLDFAVRLCEMIS